MRKILLWNEIDSRRGLALHRVNRAFQWTDRIVSAIVVIGERSREDGVLRLARMRVAHYLTTLFFRILRRHTRTHTQNRRAGAQVAESTHTHDEYLHAYVFRKQCPAVWFLRTCCVKYFSSLTTRVFFRIISINIYVNRDFLHSKWTKSVSRERSSRLISFYFLVTKRIFERCCRWTCFYTMFINIANVC